MFGLPTKEEIIESITEQFNEAQGNINNAEAVVKALKDLFKSSVDNCPKDSRISYPVSIHLLGCEPEINVNQNTAEKIIKLLEEDVKESKKENEAMYQEKLTQINIDFSDEPAATTEA